MKFFVYSLFVGFGISFTSFGQELTPPVILTQDLLPGDFSTDVVDLQNFLYIDPDTRIIPPDVGRFGNKTLNGIAHFQNKYQRSILSPFNRLATGSAEVMTRFKIATIGIKANPTSLRDPQIRADFRILLSQTLNKLDEEIAKRNDPNYQPTGQPVTNTQDGIMYFRGREVPQDVSIGRPGRYEISSTEGFIVNETGEQFHYQLPQTILQPIDNPKTFDDLFNNYDYLQELQQEIIYTSLEPGSLPQSVVVGENGAALRLDSSTLNNATTQTIPGINSGIFNPQGVSPTQITPGTNPVLFDFDEVFRNSSPQSNLGTPVPLVISSAQYSYNTKEDLVVRIFGSDLTPETQGVFYQDDETFPAQTTFKSESEIHLALPDGMQTGPAAIGIEGQAHSAVEVFVSNCTNSRCTEPFIEELDPENITYDVPVEIVGEGFSRKNNTVETSTGIYYNLPSSNGGTKITFTPEYPFTVALENSEGNTDPVAIRVLNEEGMSNAKMTNATLNVGVTHMAQQERGDTQDGEQAQNTFLAEHLKSSGQRVSLINNEGLVSKVRSVLSETGYDQVKNNTENSFVLGDSLEQDDDVSNSGFFAALSELFIPSKKQDRTFLETIGFVETAHAFSTTPYGGRVTASAPCTCSGNWIVLVADPRGLSHLLVIQPGYTRLYAHFNAYTPGVGVLGTYTLTPPGVESCWMVAVIGCFPIPTTGMMDAFPGTGTTPI